MSNSRDEYVNRNKNLKTQSTSVQSKKGSEQTGTNEWMREEVSEGPGSVRVSISIGHSEDYGRNKFSVTVDHGLSCGQAAEEKEAAYRESKSFCMDKVRELREEVIRAVFAPDSSRSSK